MRRFLSLFAWFALTAFGVSRAHGEFDASGSQAGPVQIQANRPRQAQNLDYTRLLKLINAPPGAVLVIDGDFIINLKVIVAPPGQPAKPKPGPAKKRVPKPRKTPRFDKAEAVNAHDW
jgi:hypothetical protein